MKANKIIPENQFVPIPFLTLGLLPEHQLFQLVAQFVNQGLTVIEFGFPFSDSIADGPVIQTANQQALLNGFTAQQGFQTICRIKERFPHLNIALMVYTNLVYGIGLDHFYHRAYHAGISAVMIPDVPNIEALPFIQAAKRNHVHPVLFATLSCDDADLAFTATHSEGFIYLISRAGVTGINQSAQFDQLPQIIQQLRPLTDTPIVCGFGIKQQADLHAVEQMGSQGAVIGSALIQAIISRNESKISAILKCFYPKILNTMT